VLQCVASSYMSAKEPVTLLVSLPQGVVASCCSVLQCVAVCCIVLYVRKRAHHIACVPPTGTLLHRVAVLQCVAVCYIVLYVRKGARHIDRLSLLSVVSFLLCFFGFLTIARFCLKSAVSV